MHHIDWSDVFSGTHHLAHDVLRREGDTAFEGLFYLQVELGWLAVERKETYMATKLTFGV
jgi:hypothetical protein